MLIGNREPQWGSWFTCSTPYHVRIYTDQGLCRQGERTDSTQAAGAIIDSFERLQYGQDPWNVDARASSSPRSRAWR